MPGLIEQAAEQLETRLRISQAILEANVYEHPRVVSRRIVKIFLGAITGSTLFVLLFALLQSATISIPFLSILLLLPVSPFVAYVSIIFATLPLVGLKIKASSRSAAITFNSPFLAIYFATAVAVKSGIAFCFEELEKKPLVWGSLTKEAIRYKSYRVLLDETSSYVEYANSTSNEWLRDYMHDLASNMKAGADILRLAYDKLDETNEKFRIELASRAEFLLLLAGAAILTYATLPLIIISMSLMFISLGSAGESENLITLSYIVLVSMGLFLPIGEAVKPPFEFAIQHQGKAYLLASVLGAATAIVTIAIGYPTHIVMFTTMLVFSAPLGMHFMREDRYNRLMLRGTSRFLFELQERIRYGSPILVAMKKISERDFNPPFDTLLRRFVNNISLFGITGAFEFLFANARNDYVRKVFSIIEFTSRSGSEDPQLYYTLNQFFRKLVESINSFRNTTQSFTIIGLLGVSTMVYGLSTIFTNINQLIELGNVAQSSALIGITDQVKLLVPMVAFGTGILTGFFATGKMLGAFREGTLIIAFTFVIALALGVA